MTHRKSQIQLKHHINLQVHQNRFAKVLLQPYNKHKKIDWLGLKRHHQLGARLNADTLNSELLKPGWETLQRARVGLTIGDIQAGTGNLNALTNGHFDLSEEIVCVEEASCDAAVFGDDIRMILEWMALTLFWCTGRSKTLSPNWGSRPS